MHIFFFESNSAFEIQQKILCPNNLMKKLILCAAHLQLMMKNIGETAVWPVLSYWYWNSSCINNSYLINGLDHKNCEQKFFRLFFFSKWQKIHQTEGNVFLQKCFTFKVFYRGNPTFDVKLQNLCLKFKLYSKSNLKIQTQ